MKNRNWLQGLDSVDGNYNEFIKSYIPQLSPEQIRANQDKFKRDFRDYEKPGWGEKYQKGIRDSGRTDFERYFYEQYLPLYEKLVELRKHSK
jgi:hypothetical protein